MDDAKKSDNLPPGFRFHPTDEELITYYLKNKISDSNFTAKAIADVDLNRCEPWDIPGKAKMGEKEWYFFNLRDRKYPTGVRTNRATNAGYWKTTGKDKEIFNSSTSDLVGMKKTLVFYKGRAPRGEKTNWVIHEYRVHAKSTFKNSKDEWVVCRAFKKSSGAKKYTNPNTSTQARSTTFNNINPYTNQALHHDHLLHSTLLPPLHHPDPYYGSTSSRSYMAATDLAELTRLLTSNTTTRGGNQQAMMVNTMPQQVQQQQNQANFTVSGLNLNLGVHPQHGQVVGRPMHGSAGFGVLGGEVGLGGETGFVGVHDQVNNQAHAGGNRFNNNANMEACVELDGYWGAGNY